MEKEDNVIALYFTPIFRWSLTSFPLHFFGLFHSIRQISIPQHPIRSFSFLLPFLKT